MWMDILTFLDILLKPPQPFTGLFLFLDLVDPFLTYGRSSNFDIGRVVDKGPVYTMKG